MCASIICPTERPSDGADPGRRPRGNAVKGRTENDLLKLPLDVYLFRPGFIQPTHGVAPKFVTSNDTIGRAMLSVARSGGPKRVLETADINLI